MSIKLRKLYWELVFSEESQTQRKIKLVAKMLAKLIRGGTGGGYVPPTGWEKVRITIWLVIIASCTMLLYFALIFASIPR
jgi:hypothetical protein